MGKHDENAKQAEDIQKNKDGDLSGKILEHPEELDSPVNRDENPKPDGKSLTFNEDPSIDPDKVVDKPSFNRAKI